MNNYTAFLDEDREVWHHGRTTCITEAVTRLSRPDLTLSVALWSCWHSPCSWYRHNNQWHGSFPRPQPPPPPLTLHYRCYSQKSHGNSVLVCWVPLQIVFTNRYAGNENILLLFTLTLAYMVRPVCPLWDNLHGWGGGGGKIAKRPGQLTRTWEWKLNRGNMRTGSSAWLLVLSRVAAQ